jgi:hypothetical protein
MGAAPRKRAVHWVQTKGLVNNLCDKDLGTGRSMHFAVLQCLRFELPSLEKIPMLEVLQVVLP